MAYDKKLITGGSPILRITDRYDSDTASENTDEQAPASHSGEVVPYVAKNAAARPSQSRGLPKLHITVPSSSSPVKHVSIPAMEFSSASIRSEPANDSGNKGGNKPGDTKSSNEQVHVKPTVTANTNATSTAATTTPSTSQKGLPEAHIDPRTSNGTSPANAKTTVPAASATVTSPPETCPMLNVDNFATIASSGSTCCDNGGCATGCSVCPVEMMPISPAVSCPCVLPTVPASCGTCACACNVTDPSNMKNKELDASLHVWFGFKNYILPRMDTELAKWSMLDGRPLCNALPSACKSPPNCCEILLANCMLTDIRILVYSIVLFLVIVMTVVAIPTSQIDGTGRRCWTFWGYKSNCDNATYTYAAGVLPCGPTMRRLRAGAAFSIISLFFLLAAFIAAYVCIFRVASKPFNSSLRARIVIGVLGILAAIAQLLTWPFIANIENAQYCDSDSSAERQITYGVGFGFFLSGWVLNMLGLFFLLCIPTFCLYSEVED